MSRDGRLPSAHAPLIDDGSNQVHISAITIAEISIKSSLGKLRMPGDLEEVALERGFTMLPFTSAHARRLAQLPLLHRDPFDRMLISQAQADDLALLTADPQCRRYDVRTP